LEIVDLIGNLANHGKRQLESAAVQLIRTMKSSVMKSSQAQFHCLLSGLRMRTITFDQQPLSRLASWQITVSGSWKHWDTTDLDHEVNFHEAIAGTTPYLIERLEDEYVRLEITDLIGDLANHGERQLESTCGTTDLDYEVEFRQAVARTIPSLNKLLENEENCVRWNTIELIGNLANHGE